MKIIALRGLFISLDAPYMHISNHMFRIAIFGSGTGSNARRLIEFFRDSKKIKINVLVSDKPRRGFVDISFEHRINLEIINGSELKDKKWLNHFKLKYRPDLIILAGFLQLIPEEMLTEFPEKIINIHPALLPKYGGKGMFGNHVHAAVIKAGEKESGITIHFVNSRYDEGAVIKQYACPVFPDDTLETLSKRIHELEHKYLPETVSALAESWK